MRVYTNNASNKISLETMLSTIDLCQVSSSSTWRSQGVHSTKERKKFKNTFAKK